VTLGRRTPLKRGNGVNRVNKTRRASTFKRAYGSKARVRWVAQLPCWACNYHGPTPRQNAHTRVAGMGYKAGYETIIALCPPCHMRQEDKGWLAIGMTQESADRAAAWTNDQWEARRGDSQDDGEA